MRVIVWTLQGFYPSTAQEHSEGNTFLITRVSNGGGFILCSFQVVEQREETTTVKG